MNTTIHPEVTELGTPVAYADPVDTATYGVYGSIPSQGLTPGNGFIRPRYPFRDRLSADGSTGLRAEPGRYHLYLGAVCPWAQRTHLVRDLLGLQEVISVGFVHPQRDARGWAFREETGPDLVGGFTFLQQAYEATSPGWDGHTSVPALWDRVQRRIVNNEYSDIIRDLATEFGEWAAPDAPDLYPSTLRAQIDEVTDHLYRTINNGVYRVAGAVDEESYESNRQVVISSLASYDEYLASHRYLVGERFTLADLQLWATVVRFDLGYNRIFRVSERSIEDFPNVWDWARDLYQSHPAFAETTDFAVIGGLGGKRAKESFIVDAGFKIDPPQADPDWRTPVDRSHLGGTWA